jgi:hypothetical protein
VPPRSLCNGGERPELQRYAPAARCRGLTDAHWLDSLVIYADGTGVTGGHDMQRKRRQRVGWALESVLIALCLAIFGVLFWLAVG